MTSKHPSPNQPTNDPGAYPSSKAALLIGGLLAPGLGLKWMIDHDDRKQFEEVVARYPGRDRDMLFAFWREARGRRLQRYEDALEALWLLDSAADRMVAADRVYKAARTLDDRSCDPRVAVWVLRDAVSNWFRVMSDGEFKDPGSVGSSSSVLDDALLELVEDRRSGRDESDAG